MHTGLTHIYTGNGKGKTTAAVGLAVRARSRGLSVLFVQFFKDPQTGIERDALKKLGVETRIFDAVKSPYFNPSLDPLSIRNEALAALAEIETFFSGQRHNLIVLDEFICLVSEKIISEDEAIAFMKKKPGPVELVLTGRGAPESLLQCADYVTEMQMVRHPYEANIKARKGIEY